MKRGGIDLDTETCSEGALCAETCGIYCVRLESRCHQPRDVWELSKIEEASRDSLFLYRIQEEND